MLGVEDDVARLVVGDDVDGASLEQFIDPADAAPLDLLRGDSGHYGTPVDTRNNTNNGAVLRL
jgi:hypothetical protein